MVVGPELREPLRSHHDMERDQAKYFKKSLKFYDTLAKRYEHLLYLLIPCFGFGTEMLTRIRRSAHNGHVIDLFAGCLDQVGLLEMKSLANNTGGHVVLTDSFTSSMYRQSFIRIFDKDDNENLLMGFNASMEVLTTKELKLTGLIGHAISLNKKSASVSETECGIGNTCSWKMAGIDPGSSYAIFFEIAGQSGAQPMGGGQQRAVFQILTYYQHSGGQYHLRVTTVARPLSGPSGDPAIAQGFDQEAAAVLMSRIAVLRARSMTDPMSCAGLIECSSDSAQGLLSTERTTHPASGWNATSPSTHSSCSTSAARNSSRSSTTVRTRPPSTDTSSIMKIAVTA
jgi:protein transport protein SEC23